jgi:hypothetical protein
MYRQEEALSDLRLRALRLMWADEPMEGPFQAVWMPRPTLTEWPEPKDVLAFCSWTEVDWSSKRRS